MQDKELKGIFEQGEAWVVRIRRKGQNYSKSFPFTTLTRSSKPNALKKAIDWREKQLRSVLAFGVKPSADLETLTLKDVLDEFKHYLEEEKKNGFKNRKGGLQELGKFNAIEANAKHLLNQSVADLTEQHFLDIRRQFDNGLKPASVNLYLGVYSAAYLYYADKHKIKSLKFPTGLNLKVNNKQTNTTDLETFEAIVSKVDSTITQNALKLLYYTGARRSEICKARFEEVDWVEGLIQQATSKNDDPRSIYLNSKCMKILEAMRGEDKKKKGYIFSSNGGKTPFHKDTFTRAWVRGRARLYEETKDEEIKKINLHALRHSFVTRMVTKIENDLILKKITGHRSTRSLERYEHAKAKIVKQKYGHILEE